MWTEERGEEGTSLVLQPASSKEAHVTTENEHGKIGNPNIVGSKRSRSPSSKKTKESKYEDLKYSCDQCEFTTTTSGQLKYHKEIEHEGIRYSCDLCNYASKAATNLQYHK